MKNGNAPVLRRERSCGSAEEVLRGLVRSALRERGEPVHRGSFDVIALLKRALDDAERLALALTPVLTGERGHSADLERVKGSESRVIQAVAEDVSASHRDVRVAGLGGEDSEVSNERDGIHGVNPFGFVQCVRHCGGRPASAGAVPCCYRGFQGAEPPGFLAGWVAEGRQRQPTQEC